MAGINMGICWKTRLCEVDGRLGYFHTWEHYSKPIEASPMIGGHPGCVLSKVFGIVEFEDDVKRVDPSEIKFVDEENSMLAGMNKCKAEFNAGRNDT